jgi:hypothetical protein
MNKEEYIGKYIAFDSPTGSVWAKVTGVVETNSIEGYSDSFILENRRFCSGNGIGKVLGKSLLKCDFVNRSNIFDLDNISEDWIDKLFLGVLSSSGSSNLSAVDLIPVDLIKEILKKEGSKDGNS